MDVHAGKTQANRKKTTSVAAVLMLGAITLGTAALAQNQDLSSRSVPDFGPNVLILDPSMTSSQLVAALTAISKEDQFSPNRHTVFFKPGAYTVEAPVGYYEQVAGLGETPSAVTINGFLTPNFGTTFPGVNVTDYFWRSMENLTITPTQNKAQNAAPNTLQWGVSQAAPLRRMQINGDLQLTNSYCGQSSGGFIADTVITGKVNPCSQQQWFMRNSNIGSWSGGVWNFVFSGVNGAPPQSYPVPPFTTLASTPASREKPFLYIDASGNYKVFAPAVKRNSSGITWSTGSAAGRSIPIGRFFIAQPTTSAAQINLALAQGKNLILTPGVYQLDRPLQVYFPNTVILGLGYATLVPQTGKAALNVADVDGVQIAGLIVDAGPVNSPVLLQMGSGFFGSALPPGGLFRHSGNPSAISDVTFRIGGATAGSAITSLQVDSADVILDNIWAWRADHGNGIGWTLNTANHGLVVNGNRVTALGLFVEHYQQEQVLWNGNAGQTLFYQSELPYDVPNQAAWTSNPVSNKTGITANGYPSYVVTTAAATHTAYGLGIYSYFNQGVNIVEDNAITVPNKPGIAIHAAGTVFLNGSGEITHVINGLGATVSKSYAGRLSPVITYP